MNSSFRVIISTLSLSISALHATHAQDDLVLKAILGHYKIPRHQVITTSHPTARQLHAQQEHLCKYADLLENVRRSFGKKTLAMIAKRETHSNAERLVDNKVFIEGIYHVLQNKVTALQDEVAALETQINHQDNSLRDLFHTKYGFRLS